MRKLLFKVSAPIVAALLLAAIFQNCAQQRTTNGEYKLSGNGEGYGGKARYDNPEGDCSGVTNPQQPVNSIERTGTRFVQIRKNCADITPPITLAPSQVQWFPHNPSVAIFEGVVYKQQGTLQPIGGVNQNVYRFCRSDGRDANGGGEVIDSLIIRGDNGALTANVLLAIYTANSSTGTLVNYGFGVNNPAAESYTGTNLPSPRFYQLDITLPGLSPLNFDLPGTAAPSVYRSTTVTCYSN